MGFAGGLVRKYAVDGKFVSEDLSMKVGRGPEVELTAAHVGELDLETFAMMGEWRQGLPNREIARSPLILLPVDPLHRGRDRFGFYIFVLSERLLGFRVDVVQGEEHVSRLEVPMSDAVVMQESQSLQGLSRNWRSCMCLCNKAPLRYP